VIFLRIKTKQKIKTTSDFRYDTGIPDWRNEDIDMLVDHNDKLILQVESIFKGIKAKS